MKSSHHEAGFTLVELMISIALMALLTTMMAAGLDFGTAAWRRERLATEAATEALTAQAALKRLLSQVEPVYSSSSRTDLSLAFDGDSEAMHFVAPIWSNAGAPILVRAVLKLGIGDHGDDLVLGSISDLAEPMLPEPNWPYDTLLTHVSVTQFRYFGQVNEETSPTWHDKWHGQSSLPSLIEVKVTRKAGLPHVNFLVAPRLWYSPACRYDIIGPTCKRQ